jgi:hypothetical protein
MKERIDRGVRAIRIEHWPEFVSRVQAAGAYRSWAFRGQPDTTYPLRSSLSRVLQDYRIDRRAWPVQEARIIRIFKRKAHLFLDHVPPDDDNFQWLAVMQHHGAPTRLLDFTWSPQVAAFFALERATRDCAVWAVHPRVTWELKGVPGEVNLRRAGVFDCYYLDGRHRFVWQGEPAIMNRRLTTQEGTFFVPGVLDVPLEDIFADHPHSPDLVHKFEFDVNSVRTEDALAVQHERDAGLALPGP